MPVFNSIFQMVLRRLVVQTRRLLHGRKWRKACARDFWIIALQRNFYTDRYRSNAHTVIKSPDPTFYLCSIHISCTELLRFSIENCTGV